MKRTYYSYKKNNSRGTALVGIIILISALFFTLTENINNLYKEKDNLVKQESIYMAQNLCLSGTIAAKNILEKTWELKMSSNSLWKNPMSNLPFFLPKGYKLSVKVRDEESCLNIRHASNDEITILLNELVSIRPAEQFKNSYIPPEDAAEFIKSFKDKSFLTSLFSSENGEILLENYPMLPAYITLLGDGKININTASKEIIYAAASHIFNKGSHYFTNAVLKKRPFGKVEDIIPCFPLHLDIEQRKKLLNRFTLKSTFFTILSCASVNNFTQNIENIVGLKKFDNRIEIKNISFAGGLNNSKINIQAQAIGKI
jgi:type II secretory pathway component PulK